jgi:hypothetical protein
LSSKSPSDGAESQASHLQRDSLPYQRGSELRTLDERVLSVMNVARYYTEAVQAALDEREEKTGFRKKYTRLTLDRRKRFLRTWLRNEHGLSEIEVSDLDAACNLAWSGKKSLDRP